MGNKPSQPGEQDSKAHKSKEFLALIARIRSNDVNLTALNLTAKQIGDDGARAICKAIGSIKSQSKLTSLSNGNVAIKVLTLENNNINVDFEEE